MSPGKAATRKAIVIGGVAIEPLDGVNDTGVQRTPLGHKNIQHTVRYTELAVDRFKDFGGDYVCWSNITGRQCCDAVISG